MLRSLTPERLIRHKRILNDEAYVNQLLRITLSALLMVNKKLAENLLAFKRFYLISFVLLF